MGNLNFIPLSTARGRDPARPVPAPRSMYGTGSSAFPTSQKETPAETRQAHRRTMEAQLHREPEVIRIRGRKTAAIRIRPVLHKEELMPVVTLPGTGAIQAAVILPVEAVIQIAATVMQMVIIPIAAMAPQVQAIQMVTAIRVMAHGPRMEEPSKMALIRQTLLHRTARPVTRCTSSKAGTPSTASHHRGALPGTDLATSRKAWPHSFHLLHNFRMICLRSLSISTASVSRFRKELPVQFGLCSSFF